MSPLGKCHWLADWDSRRRARHASRAPAPVLRKMRGVLGKVLLAIWVVVTTVGLGSLSLSHMAAMPEPDDAQRLARAMLSLRRDSTRNFLVHVIYANCSCTQRLFAHLIERGPFPETEEVVLFVGADSVKLRAAERAGFAFSSLSPAALAARYGLEAAPVLVAFDARGQLRYVGGYYSHPSTLAPLDGLIHAQVLQGARPAPLPVFGCAVSPRLQQAVDPLGLVYSKQ